MDIVQFIRDRLDEDEAISVRATGAYGFKDGRAYALMPSRRWISDLREVRVQNPEYPSPWDEMPRLVRVREDAHGAHIARHDPARVLAEVKAKRAIIEDYRVVTANAAIERANGDEVKAAAGDLIAKTLRMVLLHLAQPYEQHPDYNPAWRVE